MSSRYATQNINRLMDDGSVGYLGFQLFLNLNLKLCFCLDMRIHLVRLDFA
jgi:hypothetical protein